MPFRLEGMGGRAVISMGDSIAFLLFLEGEEVDPKRPFVSPITEAVSTSTSMGYFRLKFTAGLPIDGLLRLGRELGYCGVGASLV